MKITLSESFYPLLQDKHRYLILCGGRGSGKSEFAGRKLFYRALIEGNHCFLLMRKVRKTAKDSIIKVMLAILRENKIAFDYNKTDHRITFFNRAGLKNEFQFDGLDDPEKIKSIKGITGLWLEETTEFTEEDFMKIDLSLREPGPTYHQIIMSFNPDEAQAPWIKMRFFDKQDSSAMVHRSTVEDNPIAEIRDAYTRLLESLDDETYRQIYRFGEWARPRGLIFHWDVVPLPSIKFDEIFYGGDFGYSIDPAAVIKIYRKADEYWLEEVLYETGLTNQSLAREMKNEGIAENDDVYFDSAEPKSIDELVNEGLNVKPSLKGPDSVRAGIDILKSQKIHIVEGSENIKEEHRLYKWKTDKAGNSLPEPVKFKDHAMSAIRYGIVTHMKGARADVGFVSHDVRPD